MSQPTHWRIGNGGREEGTGLTRAQDVRGEGKKYWGRSMGFDHESACIPGSVFEGQELLIVFEEE